jgi:hypothetical protein
VGSSSCGGYVIWTMDHDPREGYALSFWEEYFEISKPAHSYRARYEKRNMDICTFPGYPIVIFQEEEMI